MNNKTDSLETYFSQNQTRFFLVVMLFCCIFLPSTLIFFILIALNIPHFFLSSFYKIKSQGRNSGITIYHEVSLLLLTTGLAYLNPQIVIYGAISRFLFHFFEDRFFNYNTHSHLLNTLILSLFLVDNFPVISEKYKVYLISFTGVIILYFFIKRKLTGFLNFYVIFYFVSLMPTLFHLNVNSTAWFSFGTLHSILWFSWEGVDNNTVNIKKIVKSNSFILTLIFVLICSLSLLLEGISTDWYMKNVYMFFNIILFQHVFSDDFYKLTQKFASKIKNV